MDALRSLRERLTAPVDAAGLVYFRVLMGAAVIWEVGRFVTLGRVEAYWTDPSFWFWYGPFDFVQPWPGAGMYLHMAVVALAALGVVLGLFYRVSAMLMWLGLTYLFLLDQSTYLNHFYLICLLAFLTAVLPLHHAASLDVKRGAVKPSQTVSTWVLWLVRFQLAVPYVGGGIAKLNADWLHGEPLRMWLAARSSDALFGRFFTLEPVIYLMSYGGLLLDLLGPFFLLFPKTRRWAFLAYLTFHTMNSRLFTIGVFPWVMIAATVVFFPPEWPRRLWRDVKEENGRAIAALLIGASFGFSLSTQFPATESGVQALLGAVGWAVFAYDLARGIPEPAPAASRGMLAAPTAVLLAVWVGAQVIVPLRHLWIPGNVHWTEEGHNFSWHMKLRDKRALTKFWVHPPDGDRFPIRQQDWLSRRQMHKMSTRPALMVKFAHHVASTYEAREGVRPRVTVDAGCSLNNRSIQRMIDPEQDLASVPLDYSAPAPWILPLTTPLPAARDPERKR